MKCLVMTRSDRQCGVVSGFRVKLYLKNFRMFKVFPGWLAIAVLASMLMIFVTLARAASLRPPPNAPVSARVAFAAWLEQMELRDEARKHWKALAAERPEDNKLKSLAME